MRQQKQLQVKFMFLSGDKSAALEDRYREALLLAAKLTQLVNSGVEFSSIKYQGNDYYMCDRYDSYIIWVEEEGSTPHDSVSFAGNHAVADWVKNNPDRVKHLKSLAREGSGY